MSKVEELAEKAYPEGDTYIFGDASIACQVAYVKGYHQAEKDLELGWEDIKQICDIVFEEACRLQRNMKGSLIYKEQHYQEVLKRFKDFKERKEKCR